MFKKYGAPIVLVYIGVLTIAWFEGGADGLGIGFGIVTTLLGLIWAMYKGDSPAHNHGMGPGK